MKKEKMPTEKVVVNLHLDLFEWLTKQADRRRTTRAYVIRDMINQAMIADKTTEREVKYG